MSGSAAARAIAETASSRPVPRARPQTAVSAVIVSYFTGPLLARAIASLKAQPDVGEIIVVDNGNWPGEIEKAAWSRVGQVWGPPPPAISARGAGRPRIFCSPTPRLLCPPAASRGSWPTAPG